MHQSKACLGTGLCLLAVSAVVAGPFEIWHPRSPLPTDKTLNSVAYGNGRFVAVGNEGAIVTSTDGVDWSLGASGVPNQLNTVTFGAGRFVVGGNGGVILWSMDGLNWTNASVPVINHINGIGFGVTSSFFNGLFVAMSSPPAGGRSTIVTSTNGENWATNANFDSGALSVFYSSISSGNNLFVASGSRSTFPPDPRAIYSLSGTNWALSNTGPIGPVAFANGRFVLADHFRANSNGVGLFVMSSADGYFWRGQGTAGGDLLEVPQGACFGGGKFAVVGDGGLTAVSPDGTNWTAQRVATDAQLRSVAYGGGVYVAVGSGGFIASSADAESWTQRSQGTSRNLWAVAPADDGFIAVGSQGTVTWSSNGIAWETFTAPTAESLLAVMKADSKFVAAGANGTILSGDGPGNLMPRVSGTSNSLQGIAYGSGRFVIVGDAGTILSSQNGVDWTAENSGTTSSLIDVVYGNGQFAAVGDGATALTSSDGSVWFARLTGVTRPLREISYGGGRFVATAGNGTLPDTNVYVAASLDGESWESVPAVVPEISTGTSFGNGYFLIFLRAFNPSQIATSTDGRSWNHHTMATNFPPGRDTAFNNGTFIGVGRFGRIAQSDPVVRLEVRYDGMAHLAWEGLKAGQYRIDALESLSETNSWQALTTILSPPFSWTDPESAGRSNRIYRAVLLP